MKTVYSTLFSIFFFSVTAFSQQATLSAGGEATGSGGSSSFSIGQVAYQNVSDVGGSVNEGVQQSFTGGCVQPTPTVTGFPNVTHRSVTINWTGAPLEPGSIFVIRYHEFGNSPNYQYHEVSNGNANQRYINGLEPSTHYVFRVGTKCPGSVFATFSDTASVVTNSYCTPPTGMASIPSVDAVVLSWDDVGADSYKVKYREESGSWVYRNTTAASTTITGLSASTVHLWKVRSICIAGNRPYATQQEFTTAAFRFAINGSSIDQFRVYPNPTLGNLTVDLSSDIDQLLNIELTDLSGRVVGKETVQSNAGGTRTSLNLGNLVSGIYFVRILNVNGSLLHTEKISKN